MEIQDWLATASTEWFEQDVCVAPVCLRKGIFSIGALDNINHNPSSATATSSFHGTGISIFQLPMQSNPGESRLPLKIPPSGTGTHSLPDSYAAVPSVELNTTGTTVPACVIGETASSLEVQKAKERGWVDYSMELLDKEDLTGEDKIMWSAYHSVREMLTNDPPVTSALLPLFLRESLNASHD